MVLSLSSPLYAAMRRFTLARYVGVKTLLISRPGQGIHPAIFSSRKSTMQYVAYSVERVLFIMLLLLLIQQGN